VLCWDFLLTTGVEPTQEEAEIAANFALNEANHHRRYEQHADYRCAYHTPKRTPEIDKRWANLHEQQNIYADWGKKWDDTTATNIFDPVNRLHNR
jgi:hypothetical protein